jgi:hypothetical protein
MTLKTDILSDLDSVFFNNDEFSENLTYTPSGGKATTIKGIFTDPYEAVNPATHEAETTAPTVLAMNADITGIAHGDIITRGSTAYEVIGIQPDTHGTTRLVLSEDEA